MSRLGTLCRRVCAQLSVGGSAVSTASTGAGLSCIASFSSLCTDIAVGSGRVMVLMEVVLIQERVVLRDRQDQGRPLLSHFSVQGGADSLGWEAPMSYLMSPVSSQS